MLQFPPWKVGLIFLVLLWGVLMALPNVVNMSGMPGWMPHKSVNLGLDLRGGVYLMMEIEPDEVVANRLSVLARDVSSNLRGTSVSDRLYNETKVVGRDLIVKLTRPNDDGTFRTAEALKRLEKLNGPVGGVIGGAKMYDMEITGPDTITISVPQAAEESLVKDALAKTMTIVRRRVDPDGVSEISLTPQGTDRIILEAPGEPDPQRLKNLLSRDGRMTFNLVESSPSEIARVQAGVPKSGYHLLSGPESGPLLVRDIPEIVGSDIANAAQSFDERNRPQITFRLNTAGARKFYETTRNNTGKLFAIVLDDVIMSAPRIDEPIAGGNVRITGNFTQQEAIDLAAIIEAGEMPAKLQFLDQRTVSPTLGQDSINAGYTAAIIGLLAVAVFMVLAYGTLGFFAVLSLACNIVLIFAGLSGINATLTLPGIAGIILTIGMAVDANVLVFERIREEQNDGRSPWTATQAGYERALSTIMDANITTLIAATILYLLGSGPVKGFAVTLSIGIVTSVFTAYVVTRMITVGWMKLLKPKRFNI
ncbi:MAG TPA: protein translocase subunit SecD [Hyphomonas sp.]|nr:protein translocase subunit SecD [Hyphomonas sp.]